jgi:hypothetical protein
VSVFGGKCLVLPLCCTGGRMESMWVMPLWVMVVVPSVCVVVTGLRVVRSVRMLPRLWDACHGGFGMSVVHVGSLMPCGRCGVFFGV